jgi:serine/threonine protein kinase
MAAGDEYEGPLAAHLVPNTRYKDEYRTGSELLAQARGLCYTWRRCHHRKTRLHCAVKIFDVTHMDFHEQALAVEVALLKEMRDSNAQGVTRFIGLFHSHNSAQFQLVTSYESGGEPLFDCIAHKWFRVADTFDSRPYDEESASTIFRSIVKSVNEMHQRNIVHGNLSPTAIILDHQDLNSAHLVDLQWAQKLEAGRSTHKQCGTPGYASPEQLTGLRSFRMTEFNQMADLWSLGVLMYQLLCGYPPFKGEGAEVIAATLRGKYKCATRFCIYPTFARDANINACEIVCAYITAYACIV